MQPIIFDKTHKILICTYCTSALPNNTKALYNHFKRDEKAERCSREQRQSTNRLISDEFSTNQAVTFESLMVKHPKSLPQNLELVSRKDKFTFPKVQQLKIENGYTCVYTKKSDNLPCLWTKNNKQQVSSHYVKEHGPLNSDEIINTRIQTYIPSKNSSFPVELGHYNTYPSQTTSGDVPITQLHHHNPNNAATNATTNVLSLRSSTDDDETTLASQMQLYNEQSYHKKFSPAPPSYLALLGTQQSAFAHEHDAVRHPIPANSRGHTDDSTNISSLEQSTDGELSDDDDTISVDHTYTRSPQKRTFQALEDDAFADTILARNKLNQFNTSSIIRKSTRKEDSSPWVKDLGHDQHLHNIRHYYIRMAYDVDNSYSHGSVKPPANEPNRTINWEISCIASHAIQDIHNVAAAMTVTGPPFQRYQLITNKIDGLNANRCRFTTKLQPATITKYAKTWAHTLAYTWRIFRCKQQLFGPKYDWTEPNGPRNTTLDKPQTEAATRIKTILDNWELSGDEKSKSLCDAIRELTYTLYRTNIGSKPYKNPVLSFAALRVVHFDPNYIKLYENSKMDPDMEKMDTYNDDYVYNPRLNTKFFNPNSYTPCIAALQWIFRLYELRRNSIHTDDITANEELRAAIAKYLHELGETTFGYLSSWKTKASADASQYRPQSGLWDSENSTLQYDGQRFAMSDLTALMTSAYYEAKLVLDTNLLFGDTNHPEPDWNIMFDDETQEEPGASFVTGKTVRQMMKTDNFDASKYLFMLIAKTKNLNETYLVDGAWKNTTHLQHRHIGHRDYENYVQRFLEHLLVAIHLTAGAPLRGPEILSLRWCNEDGNNKRNLYIFDKTIMIQTTYHKSSTRTGLSNTVHFLPQQLATILFKFCAFVQPLRLWFLQCEQKYASRSNVHPYLFSKADDDPFSPISRNTNNLTDYLHSACRRNRLDDFGVSKYRHITACIIKHMTALENLPNAPQKRLKNTAGLARHQIAPIPALVSDIDENEDQEYNDPTDLTDDDDDSHLNDISYRYAIEAASRQSNHSATTLENSYAGTSVILQYETNRGAFSSANWRRWFKLDKALCAAESGDYAPPDIFYSSNPYTVQARFNRISKTAITQTLSRVYGPRYRLRQGQRQTLKSLCYGNVKDQVLFIAGTGYGKTITYILPAAVTTARITLVILPLVALRKQLENICKARGLGYSAWHHDTPASQLTNCPIIAIPAENVDDQRFKKWVANAIHSGNLDRIVIDECHILYTEVNYRHRLKNIGSIIRTHNVQTLWLTATLPPSLENSFLTTHDLHTPKIIRMKTNRCNIEYNVERQPPDQEPSHFNTFLIKRAKQEWTTIITTGQQTGTRTKALIYCKTTYRAKTLAKALNTEAYHRYAGDNDADKKQQIIDRWLTNPSQPWLVATTSLGAGFDYDDIRLIIHADSPHSLIGFVQESGRAGRSGQLSKSLVLLPSDYDSNSASEHTAAPEDTNQLKLYLSTTHCLRALISQYMDQPSDWIWCDPFQPKCSVCTSNAHSHALPNPRPANAFLTNNNNWKTFAATTYSRPQVPSQSEPHHNTNILPALLPRPPSSQQTTATTVSLHSSPTDITSPESTNAAPDKLPLRKPPRFINFGGNEIQKDKLRSELKLHEDYHTIWQIYQLQCVYCKAQNALHQHTKHNCPNNQQYTDIEDYIRKVKRPRLNHPKATDKWVSVQYVACYKCLNPAKVCPPTTQLKERSCNSPDFERAFVLQVVATAWDNFRARVFEDFDISFMVQHDFILWCGEPYKPIIHKSPQLLNVHAVAVKLHQYISTH